MVTTLRADSALVAFETLYLDWIRNIGIFIVAAIAFLSFLGTHDLAFWIFVVSLFLLIIAQIDYFFQRQALVERGIDIPVRIDLLWVGSTGVFFILLWTLWKIDSSSGEHVFFQKFIEITKR
uniref:Uncharacterized protein n=1 Tax=Pithovirus LCPAC304 TaxID=2506594 RepID=A0A481Z7C2_9VIRU|nr:MAG: uncharacterized protein LCPAC304_01120 [Pithovirus LCPAC304]